MFAGDNPILGASAYVAGPLTMLLANDIEPVTLEGARRHGRRRRRSRARATIERVWLDDIRPRAGRTVPLKVLTRSYRGDEKISTMPIEIPGERRRAADGAGHRRPAAQRHRAARAAPAALQPQSVAQMISVLNETRRNNRIYVRLLTGTPGAVVNGEAMTALPPSVLSVLEGDRSGGSFTPIRSAALGEWETPDGRRRHRLARADDRPRRPR